MKSSIFYLVSEISSYMGYRTEMEGENQLLTAAFSAFEDHRKGDFVFRFRKGRIQLGAEFFKLVVEAKYPQTGLESESRDKIMEIMIISATMFMLRHSTRALTLPKEMSDFFSLASAAIAQHTLWGSEVSNNFLKDLLEETKSRTFEGLVHELFNSMDPTEIPSAFIDVLDPEDNYSDIFEYDPETLMKSNSISAGNEESPENEVRPETGHKINISSFLGFLARTKKKELKRVRNYQWCPELRGLEANFNSKKAMKIHLWIDKSGSYNDALPKVLGWLQIALRQGMFNDIEVWFFDTHADGPYFYDVDNIKDLKVENAGGGTSIEELIEKDVTTDPVVVITDGYFSVSESVPNSLVIVTEESSVAEGLRKYFTVVKYLPIEED